MKEDGSSVIRRSSVLSLCLSSDLSLLFFLVKKSVVAESLLDGGRVARAMPRIRSARGGLCGDSNRGFGFWFRVFSRLVGEGGFECRVGPR